MSVDQLGLLDQWEQDSDEKERQDAARERIEYHQRMRLVCWPEWSGPAVGGFCEVGTCIAKKAEGGMIYAYTELCRLLDHRDDGTWLAVIEMGEVHGKPWHKDGTRLILEETDIWPPVRLLSEAPRAAEQTDSEG